MDSYLNTAYMNSKTYELKKSWVNNLYMKNQFLQNLRLKATLITYCV